MVRRPPWATHACLTSRRRAEQPRRSHRATEGPKTGTPFFLKDRRYLACMKLHGPIVENLDHAFASARRLRNHPVYKETLTYWDELLQEARRARQDPGCRDTAMLDAAILRLELELAERAK